MLSYGEICDMGGRSGGMHGGGKCLGENVWGKMFEGRGEMLRGGGMSRSRKSILIYNKDINN